MGVSVPSPLVGCGMWESNVIKLEGMGRGKKDEMEGKIEILKGEKKIHGDHQLLP